MRGDVEINFAVRTRVRAPCSECRLPSTLGFQTAAPLRWRRRTILWEMFCAGNAPDKARQSHWNIICARRHVQKQKGVIFAGYKMPHPLEHKFVLRVQTEKPLTPTAVLERTVDQLIGDLATLEERVRVWDV